MTHIDFVKKLKLLKPQELTPGVLGCFFFSLCLIFFLFLLDFRILNGLQGHILFLSWFKSNSQSVKVGFLEDGGENCDIFRGKWMWDESYPLYQSQDCMFLDTGFRCSENGRPDSFYTKWRWQPSDCNLPRAYIVWKLTPYLSSAFMRRLVVVEFEKIEVVRFDAKMMLEKLRGRRVVFAGDSVGRNQWESLVCMLSSVIPNKSSIYEVNGNPITKHSGALIFKFSDYNCTLEYYRAPFLVLQSRAAAAAPPSVKLTLKLDRLDWSSAHWKGADLLVFNTGHWWNPEKTIRLGCYFQQGDEIEMEMSVRDAFERSVKTLSQWITRELNLSKTHVVFRSYAPVHFRGGDWKKGGTCHLETLPDFTISPLSSLNYSAYTSVVEGLSEQLRAGNVELLNVTAMTSQRKDGHPSLYYLAGPSPIHRQDCSHWCLPGVPDSWNQLLYALFLKRHSQMPI